jgi:hypothetical protein
MTRQGRPRAAERARGQLEPHDDPSRAQPDRLDPTDVWQTPEATIRTRTSPGLRSEGWVTGQSARVSSGALCAGKTAACCLEGMS